MATVRVKLTDGEVETFADRDNKGFVSQHRDDYDEWHERVRHSWHEREDGALEVIRKVWRAESDHASFELRSQSRVGLFPRGTWLTVRDT